MPAARLLSAGQQLLVLLALLALSACGFQLRGSVDFSPALDPLYVSGESPNSNLNIDVKNLLDAYGAELSRSSSDAKYQLLISAAASEQRTIAIGDGAKAVGFQLTESASFELRNRQGVIVMGPSIVIERQTINNDPDQVASSSSIAGLTRNEMRKNLAQKIVRQLYTYDPSQPAGPSQ